MNSSKIFPKSGSYSKKLQNLNLIYLEAMKQQTKTFCSLLKNEKLLRIKDMKTELNLKDESNPD